MKKRLDKLISKIRINRRYFVFLLIVMIIGVITGSLFVIILKDSDKGLVANQLFSFFEKVNTGKLNYLDVLFNSFISNFIYMLIIWILGISIIGIPIVIFMLFSKCFVLGFSISNIIFNYGFRGIIISFFYTFPHYFIDLIMYMFITMFSLSLSIRLVRSFIAKKEINFKHIFNKYLIVLAISCVIILFSALYETYVMPNIIRYIRIANVSK